MPRVTFNRLTKKRATYKRRRSSVLTKAKFKPKTARANRSLIKGNAAAIQAIKRIMPRPVYTDYQLSFTQQATLSAAASGLYMSYASTELMRLNDWVPVLRQDANAIASSATRILRMQANMRYAIQESSTVQITAFVVTIRKDAADVDVDNLTEGDDYIYAKGGSATNPDLGTVPRLNSNVFKVLYTRNVTLMSNGFLQPLVPSEGANPVAIVSNSSNTQAKGQINIKLNWSVRQPSAALQWKNMLQEQLSPYQQMYLLTFFRGITPSADASAPRVDCDCLFTAYNSG